MSNECARGQVTRLLGEVSTATPEDAARVAAARKGTTGVKSCSSDNQELSSRRTSRAAVSDAPGPSVSGNQPRRIRCVLSFRASDSGFPSDFVPAQRDHSSFPRRSELGGFLGSGIWDLKLFLSLCSPAVWSLVLGAFLELGIWDLELSFPLLSAVFMGQQSAGDKSAGVRRL